MTDGELALLTHPDEWPHEALLPLSRRGGNVVYNKEDAGIVMDDNLCCVWTGVYIGEADPCTDSPFSTFAVTKQHQTHYTSTA
jgi:hypothetical protein